MGHSVAPHVPCDTLIPAVTRRECVSFDRAGENVRRWGCGRPMLRHLCCDVLTAITQGDRQLPLCLRGG
jgi:hypothetical protein